MHCSLVTAVTNDWLLIKVDSGQHSLFYDPFFFILNSMNVWEAFHDHSARNPRSSEVCVDRPFDVHLLLTDRKSVV